MATVRTMDFEVLGRDLASWYEHGDELAARRVMREIGGPVQALVRREQGSWGEEQVRDTLQEVLKHILDRDKERLENPRAGLDKVFWTVVRNKIRSEGRRLGSRRRLRKALDAEPGSDSALAPSAPGPQRPDKELIVRSELCWTRDHLPELTPNRSMAVIAYSVAAWVGSLLYFREPRDRAGEGQGRAPEEVEASYASIDEEVTQTIATAALGPTGSINAYQQNLSRGRRDLRRMRGEAA